MDIQMDVHKNQWISKSMSIKIHGYPNGYPQNPWIPKWISIKIHGYNKSKDN